MVAFIDAHRGTYGVEPICAVVPIAPSTYYEQKAQQGDPTRRPARAQRDYWLKTKIQRVWDENFGVYGPRKVWRQLRREGIKVARCTVERLMRALGLQGVIRGRTFKTTVPDETAVRPLDLVDRGLHGDAAQSALGRGSDLCRDVGRLRLRGLRHRCLRRVIVGWRVATTLRTDLVLDALEQALYDRPLDKRTSLVHHSDRGVQAGFKGSSQHVLAGVRVAVR